MLTREKCREIFNVAWENAADACETIAVTKKRTSDELFAAFEAERSAWIASMDAGDERREFEERVHRMACALALHPNVSPAGLALEAIGQVRVVDVALAKERA